METLQPLSENPLRSLLFAPGDNLKMVEKALSTGADAVIIDLEDAASETAKSKARGLVRNALEKHQAARPAGLVRINPESTPHWEPDINAVVCKNLQGVVVPKVESTQTVVSLDQLLGQRETEAGLAPRSVAVFLLIESARGVLKLSELVGCNSRIAGVIFGAEDFCLDTEIPRLPGGDALLFPRSYSVISARAFGCRAIDMVFADVNDTEGLRRECEEAKRLGFSGKLAIHPRQIDVIHRGFAPSSLELEEAKKVLEAFEEAQKKGNAVTLVSGKMIDRPVAERARRTIARADPSLLKADLPSDG